MSVEAVPPPTPSRAGARSALALGRDAITNARSFGVIGVVIVLFAVLSISSGAFLDKTNLLNILNQWSPTGIMAVAMTIVLICGCFDLSIEAVFSLTGVVAAKVTNSSGVEAGLLAGIGVGVMVGLLNALMVVKFRVNSIIATLATGFIVSGVTLQVTSGNLISVTKPGFGSLGNGSFLGVSNPTWFWLIAAVGFGLLLHRTILGRHIYAVGGNRDAARLSGVRTGRVLTLAFVLSGLAAGFAGVMVASQQATGQADASPGILYDVIAAVIVGGTSILGGAGAIWRAVVGVMLLALVQNGADLVNLSSSYQTVIYGAIILGAAALDVWARRRGDA